MEILTQEELKILKIKTLYDILINPTAYKERGYMDARLGYNFLESINNLVHTENLWTKPTFDFMNYDSVVKEFESKIEKGII